MCFTNLVLPAVSELGWERCPWCDDTFSNKRIFPGAGPRAGDAGWKMRLTVNETSMDLMFKCQIDKHITLHQICTPPKLTQSKMNESAEQAALVVSLVEEVKAMVPIPDDTLQDKSVRPYIENDTQVHLEICSVLVTRSTGFSPQDLAALKV